MKKYKEKTSESSSAAERLADYKGENTGGYVSRLQLALALLLSPTPS